MPTPRPREPSSIDLADADIVDATPRPSTPPPVPRAAQRRKDPMTMLREAIGELGFFSTPWQAAGVCAAALAKTLGARAVIVHSYDARTSEIRIIGAVGPKADLLLGAAALAEDDFVASNVISNGRPVRMLLEGGLPRIAPERARTVAASESLVAVPVNCGGAVLAMVEVVDAAQTSVSCVDAAMAYAAGQLASFLANARA